MSPTAYAVTVQPAAERIGLTDSFPGAIRKPVDKMMNPGRARATRSWAISGTMLVAFSTSPPLEDLPDSVELSCVSLLILHLMQQETMPIATALPNNVKLMSVGCGATAGGDNLFRYLRTAS